jgi:hypothetical protein
MKSKIIQITSCPWSCWQGSYPAHQVYYLFALCEDGTIWNKRPEWDWEEVKDEPKKT